LDPTVEAEILDAGFYLEPFGDAGFELAGENYREKFASYPGPSLVLNGQWDLVHRAGERKHAAAATDAEVTVLTGAGHVCNLERPSAYAVEVRDFYRSNREEFERGASTRQ
jgi:pimeloyl-ACP methyl ester carboxylesterase